MARFKLTIEYDGTGLAGWQSQPGFPSVQGFLERAAERFCGQPTRLVTAGRTDAGVHAERQVAHLDLPKPLASWNVLQGLNYYLRPLCAQIAVLEAEAVAEDFHARFSATQRHYRYDILNRSVASPLLACRAWRVPEPLDLAKMRESAAILLGTHDFTSFRASQCQAVSPVRTLDRLDVECSGEMIRLHLGARSFLHHMVRNIAGALRRAGNGKWSACDLRKALLAADRRAGAETAPPQGLYLTRVDY